MLDLKTILLPKGLKAHIQNESPREDELLYFIFTAKTKQCKSEQTFFLRRIGYF